MTKKAACPPQASRHTERANKPDQGSHSVPPHVAAAKMHRRGRARTRRIDTAPRASHLENG
jgi:hypothetical protein